MVLTSLTDEAMRAERSRIVAEEYRRRCEADQVTARNVIMTQMSMDMGITVKTIRIIVANAGLETALPNYKNCGSWMKKAQ